MAKWVKWVLIVCNWCYNLSDRCLLLFVLLWTCSAQTVQTAHIVPWLVGWFGMWLNCGQTSGWIEVPLGMDHSHIMLDGAGVPPKLEVLCTFKKFSPVGCADTTEDIWVILMSFHTVYQLVLVYQNYGDLQTTLEVRGCLKVWILVDSVVNCAVMDGFGMGSK